MKVILNDLLTGQRVELLGVSLFAKRKIVSHGRKQWCYVCQQKIMSRAFPCKTYEFVSCALDECL